MTMHRSSRSALCWQPDLLLSLRRVQLGFHCPIPGIHTSLLSHNRSHSSSSNELSCSNPRFGLLRVLLCHTRIPHPHSTTPNQPSPPQIIFHNPFHTPTIVLGLPHIIQPRPPRPLLRPLHHLNRLDGWTVDFHVHLHPCHQEAVAQQDRGIDAAPSEGQTDAAEGFAAFEGA